VILRPLVQRKVTTQNAISAWEAIAESQRTKAATYRLIRQPDHARLAAEFAARMMLPSALALDDDIMHGIALHDEGWAEFDDGRAPFLFTKAEIVDGHPAANPLSFIDIKAGDSVRAWLASIEAAEGAAPIAGLMVSHHFCRIARHAINMELYTTEDLQHVYRFTEGQQRRQARLLTLQRRSSDEVQYWTDVLQFADILSLYLCGGSTRRVHFPPSRATRGQSFLLDFCDGAYVFQPPLFAEELEFSLPAQFHPAESRTSEEPVLRWRVH